MLTSIASNGQSNLKSYQSQYGFDETIQLIKSSLDERDIEVMQVIDHDDNAEGAGMELEKTKVIVFGNPQVGTKLMQADPDIAIELPLRLLIIERNGNVTVKYTDPTLWKEKYNLEDQVETLENMTELLNNIGRIVEGGDKRTSIL